MESDDSLNNDQLQLLSYMYNLYVCICTDILNGKKKQIIYKYKISKQKNK